MVAIEQNGAACVIYESGTELVDLLEISNSSLHIDTKYFTVSVTILTPSFSQAPPPNNDINAVLIKGTFDQLTKIVEMDFFATTDVRLYMPPSAPSPSQMQFCYENEIAYLNLIEEPEGVLCSLQNSASWAGLEMKNQSTPSAAVPAQAAAPTVANLIEQSMLQDEIDDLDSLEDDFGALLSLIGRTRTAAGTQSDDQRRQNAERVALALAAMLGDDDDAE